MPLLTGSEAEGCLEIALIFWYACVMQKHEICKSEGRAEGWSVYSVTPNTQEWAFCRNENLEIWHPNNRALLPSSNTCRSTEMFWKEGSSCLYELFHAPLVYWLINSCLLTSPCLERSHNFILWWWQWKRDTAWHHSRWHVWHSQGQVLC